MLDLREITIDDELKGLLPPLGVDELTNLRDSILKDGFTSPLIVWLNHGILVDGHNRFDIWQHDLDGDDDKAPDILEKKFASKEEVREWVLRNQLARRNLTDEQRLESARKLNDAQRVQIALKLKPGIEARAKENRKTSTGGVKPQLCQKSDKAGSLDTKKEIAKAAGVSHDTVHKVETVLLVGPEEVKQAMLAGKKSINAAFKESREDARLERDITNRIRGLAHGDVELSQAKVRREVERLLGFVERTDTTARQFFPTLKTELSSFADDLESLATKLRAKSQE